MISLDLFGTIIGLVGTIFICVAFFQNIKGLWKHDSVGYLVSNLIGGTALLISLFIHFNLGSFVIEIFWISVSLYGLYKLHKGKNV